MTMAEATTTQIHRIEIKAPPERVWEAITTPEWAERYGYQAPVTYDLRPGGAFRGFPSAQMVPDGAPSGVDADAILEGEVLEVDPPRRLVQTWHALWSPELAAEPTTRLTYELEPGADGVTTLTITHEAEGAPSHAAQVSGEVENAGGGWPEILRDLKRLLEDEAPTPA